MSGETPDEEAEKISNSGLFIVSLKASYFIPAIRENVCEECLEYTEAPIPNF